MSRKKKKDPIPLEAARCLIDLWNEVAPPHFAPVRATTVKLGKARSRLNEEPSLEYWRDVIRKAKTIPWLNGMGRNMDGWRMTFEWLMRNDNNYQRVLEEAEHQPPKPANPARIRPAERRCKDCGCPEPEYDYCPQCRFERAMEGLDGAKDH